MNYEEVKSDYRKLLDRDLKPIFDGLVDLLDVEDVEQLRELQQRLVELHLAAWNAGRVDAVAELMCEYPGLDIRVHMGNEDAEE